MADKFQLVISSLWGLLVRGQWVRFRLGDSLSKCLQLLANDSSVVPGPC